LYSYTLILPVNAYVTWSCYGGAKTHVIDDFSLSPATGIETGSKKDNSFEITPNPSTGLFQLNNSSGNVVNFKVCNETGNAVMQSVLNKTQSTIDLSNQPDGIYFVEFNNNNKTFVRKLVKVK